MDKNKKLILKEIKEFHNNLISLFDDIYLLVGFAESQEDYYYILKDFNSEYRYISCVLSLNYLKKEMNDESYNNLLSKFKIESKIILKSLK